MLIAKKRKFPNLPSGKNKAIEKNPFQSAKKISMDENPQTGQIAISKDNTATTPTTAPIGMSLGLNS